MFLATTLPCTNLGCYKENQTQSLQANKKPGYPAMIYIPPPALGYWTFSLGNSVFGHSDCSRCEGWKGLIVEKVG